MTDDLRPCITHRLPINRCAPCWPMFLSHLGNACWIALIEAKATGIFWIPRGSFSKPTTREQRVFAQELRTHV